MSNSLRQRLLHDIAELQDNPYPNISLHTDGDINTACLILTVEEYNMKLHLTIHFPAEYPLDPPAVLMNSDISHPNIYGSYICASILNTTEGYTSAYTLKGIAIQLLSFFSSDTIEQDYGNVKVDLSQHRTATSSRQDNFACIKCHFGPILGSQDAHLGQNARRRRARRARRDADSEASTSMQLTSTTLPSQRGPIQTIPIPDEILLAICERLDSENLMVFAESWEKIGSLITTYDVIRTHELQCFCLKKDYNSTKLGVGVSVAPRGKFGFLESEFDLLSEEGY